MASVGTEQHHAGSKRDSEKLLTAAPFRLSVCKSRNHVTRYTPVWKLERKYVGVTHETRPDHCFVSPAVHLYSSYSKGVAPLSPTPPLIPQSGSFHRFRSFRDPFDRELVFQRFVNGHTSFQSLESLWLRRKVDIPRPYTASNKHPQITPALKLSYSSMATSLIDQRHLSSAAGELHEISLRNPSRMAERMLSENPRPALVTNSFLRPSSAKVHFYPRLDRKQTISTSSSSLHHGLKNLGQTKEDTQLYCDNCINTGPTFTNHQGAAAAKANHETDWKIVGNNYMEDTQLNDFVKPFTDTGDLLNTTPIASSIETICDDTVYTSCKKCVLSALNPAGYQDLTLLPSASSDACLNGIMDCTLANVCTQETAAHFKATSPCSSSESISYPSLYTPAPKSESHLPDIVNNVQGVNITIMATQISTIRLNKTSGSKETQVQPERIDDLQSPVPNQELDGDEEELPDDLDDSEAEEDDEDRRQSDESIGQMSAEKDGTVKPAFTKSLFPNVQPTLYFGTQEEKVERLPWAQRKLLKWKMSNVTPNVVKHAIAQSHFRITKKNHDWLGCWGHHMKSTAFKSLQAHQKLNHFPGSFQIGRKDRLWRNLSKMQTHYGKKEFSFFPQSFVLPQDIKLLKKAWEEGGNRQKWIVKPPASARGMGIQVIHKWSQLPKKRPLLVQRYLHKPYLISGSKFDLRIYVYVTSFDPLRIYMFTDGLVRFASCKYSSSMKSLSNKFMHLTNYSVNKNNADYQANPDQTACQGHKWALKALWNYLNQKGFNSEQIWEKIKDIVIKTIIASDPYVNSLVKMYVQSPYCCHELFGFDIMLDENLKPWVLEVNISPSLHSNSPLDISIKGQMIRDLLNLAGFVLPSKDEVCATSGSTSCSSISVSNLGKDKGRLVEAEEKKKRAHYLIQKIPDKDLYATVLDHLTPEDVRVLVETEDELSRCGQFERIFPSPITSRYLRFFEQPRYFNILTNQWEQKYYTDRERGQELLRSLCLMNYHAGTVLPSHLFIVPAQSDVYLNGFTRSEGMRHGTLPDPCVEENLKSLGSPHCHNGGRDTGQLEFSKQPLLSKTLSSVSQSAFVM
ncbi:tubulin polyglutamylase TTLL4 isoform X2 [Xenopus laevis]|uniref:Tubulin polyglutamylase TTLL4 isoform X2 n=1 Tax=Xenopus laevis TaxID=8355 RepID=A0A8J0TUQ2_XENLA|nr:tubulin polyglutamylase TTLL4 isoform X2 [Xenopus laevis]